MSKEELIKLIDQLKFQTKLVDSSSKKITIIANFLREQTANLLKETPKEFEIKSLIERVIDKPRCRNALHDHASKCNVTVNGEIIITGYINSVELVLGNLIQNAAEAYPEVERKEGIPTENVKPKYTIEVSAKQVDNWVLFAVKDYGCGINKEVQKDIFYETMKNKTFKKGAGGLSLFIAPAIVIGILGGEIWFSSEDQAGSTFYLLIPKSCSEKDEDDYRRILGVGDFATHKNLV